MLQSYIVVAVVAVSCVHAANKSAKVIPPYIKQCIRNDPKLNECLAAEINHLRPYLVQGIKEIELPPVEPFRMDSLSLAITGGSNGYKITLRDIDLYGASNFSIQKILLRPNLPFEGKVRIPKMTMDAKYASTGVLLVLPANGNGTFHADLGDVICTAKGVVSSYQKDSQEYYNLDVLEVDLVIKKAYMLVSKVNNNRIIVEATNLFLRENGQEVLQVMMPQLRTKLATIFKRIVNQLLTHVPAETFFSN
ncbi:uncharacterized protein LOC126847461 [Adelges cooleyi]|uniref:uncharacterized protein LOC126847461 n=1 Tax=Adelges cooleyi TaxID=133065 RepID=UPI00217F7369|nr:uncharacterized protein LOC126847461 [Adelges cooleyi]